MLLRRTSDGSTRGVSTAHLDLEPTEEADLERYLDVTRGEIVFARGVLLVEGEAEVYLLPAVGRMFGFDFDKLGISVCSVAGTHFEPYLKLIGPRGLDLPYAVLTDQDPQQDGKRPGRKRVHSLYPFTYKPNGTATACPEVDHHDFMNATEQRGLFLNDHTLEVDLFRGGQHEAIADTMLALSTNSACHGRARRWRTAPADLDPAAFLKDIEAIGKGRFAQRLASCLSGAGCPEYITKAIQFVASQCQ